MRIVFLLLVVCLFTSPALAFEKIVSKAVEAKVEEAIAKALSDKSSEKEDAPERKVKVRKNFVIPPYAAVNVEKIGEDDSDETCFAELERLSIIVPQMEILGTKRGPIDGDSMLIGVTAVAEIKGKDVYYVASCRIYDDFSAYVAGPIEIPTEQAWYTR